MIFFFPHIAQVKSVCVLVLLYIPLCMMDIPGPCKHSLTKDHLHQINHLVSGPYFVFHCNIGLNDSTNKGTEYTRRENLNWLYQLY